jgi:methionyl-tRNA formyltransferase
MPGVVKVDGARVLIGCGAGSAIEAKELQLEGKKNLTADEFIRGTRNFDGATLL